MIMIRLKLRNKDKRLKLHNYKSENSRDKTKPFKIFHLASHIKAENLHSLFFI
jgi:hypothetical protein